jgi:hypothetical protein
VITQRDEIIRVLTENGWRAVEKEDPNLDWWADEIVALESTWSPLGQRPYVTFLVDPQHDDHRQKGEAVWAAAISAQRPVDRRDAESSPMLSLGHGWKERLPVFIEQANGFRHRSSLA